MNSRKEVIRKDHGSDLPEWYWAQGLHDAQITGIRLIDQTPAWKEELPRYNCLQIDLDGEGAMFDQTVKSIRLYNCKVLSGKLPESRKDTLWWLRDTLIVVADHKYRLEWVLETGKGKHICLELEFAFAQVERITGA